jgi:hypothetical protein
LLAIVLEKTQGFDDCWRNEKAQEFLEYEWLIETHKIRTDSDQLTGDPFRESIPAVAVALSNVDLKFECNSPRGKRSQERTGKHSLK